MEQEDPFATPASDLDAEAQRFTEAALPYQRDGGLRIEALSDIQLADHRLPVLRQLLHDITEASEEAEASAAPDERWEVARHLTDMLNDKELHFTQDKLAVAINSPGFSQSSVSVYTRALRISDYHGNHGHPQPALSFADCTAMCKKKMTDQEQCQAIEQARASERTVYNVLNTKEHKPRGPHEPFCPPPDSPGTKAFKALDAIFQPFGALIIMGIDGHEEIRLLHELRKLADRYEDLLIHFDHKGFYGPTPEDVELLIQEHQNRHEAQLSSEVEDFLRNLGGDH